MTSTNGIFTTFATSLSNKVKTKHQKFSIDLDFCIQSFLDQSQLQAYI